jgi:predicted Rossmann fold flavoprotein
LHKNQTLMQPRHLIVIGGGASGVFCAVNAAGLTKGLKITVVEKTHRLLAKVEVSGGGRCNVTHQSNDIDKMSACYPRGRHFVRKAFHQFFTDDTLSWFSERGVNIVAESDGRMFPSTNKSETIIRCLLSEAERHHVQFRLRSEVIGISKEDGSFKIQLNDGTTLTADFVFIASGGQQKSASLQWIAETGHEIIPPVPSLFTFNLPGHPILKLMGVSVSEAALTIVGTKFRNTGPVLITHWGLSGPGVLRLSAMAARALHEVGYKFNIHADWLPSWSREEIKSEMVLMRNERGGQFIITRSLFGLPLRLWLFFVETAGIESDKRWADLPAARQSALIELLKGQIFEVSGKTTFKEEFVTAGGVSTRQVDPSSMQSRLIDGLYFGGEVLDVDGITGGYNFQHAWTSGWIAARHISDRV